MSDDHMDRVRAMADDGGHGTWDLSPKDIAALAAIITERDTLLAERDAARAETLALLAYYAGPVRNHLNWEAKTYTKYVRALMLDDFGNPVLREFPTLEAFAAAVKKAAKGVPDGQG